MPPLFARIRDQKRPSLLLKAAQFGLQHYKRERHLAGLLATRRSWTDEDVLDAVLSDELYLDEQRRNGDANYSVSRHVKVMIALISEARLLSAPKLVE